MEEKKGNARMRFYKYRGAGGDLTKDYALGALVNSYALFSSRKNFNDPFDSKIQLLWPTPKEIEELLQGPGIASYAETINSWITAGNFTPNGRNALINFEIALNETIDRYPMYCVSEFSDNPLLWAHYASSHTGFCIEFEFPVSGDQPKRVSYREHMDSISVLDFIKDFYRIGTAKIDLATRIHDALYVKVNCWAYESEYRWLAGNALGKLSKGQKFLKVSYDPSWVKAIIFGCRTSDEVKSYVRNNLPFATEFKKVIEKGDNFEIVLC